MYRSRALRCFFKFNAASCDSAHVRVMIRLSVSRLEDPMAAIHVCCCSGRAEAPRSPPIPPPGGVSSSLDFLGAPMGLYLLEYLF